MAEVAYSPDYHRALLDGARRSAEVVVPLVLALARPRSAVDVGCGLGAWASAFREHGVENVWGVDGDYVDRAGLLLPPERFVAHDLRRPLSLGRRFDLAICLEVAEHLPAECAAGLVASLAGLGPLVLFSAAAPYQGGTGHVNEQWPGYWARLFAARGYAAVDCLRRRVWGDERVEWWYAQNLLIFAERSRLDELPRLRAEHEWAGPEPPALVHPRRYLEWVEWGMSQCEALSAAGGRS